MTTSDILIYQTENGLTKIETRLEDEFIHSDFDQKILKKVLFL
jgi:hypothetical protein